MYTHTSKRFIDLILSIIALAFLLPLIVLISCLVLIRLGKPFLYCQQRPGQWGKPFTLYKFRSMSEARDSHGKLLLDVDRLTAFGRFLRRLSLDELPALFNVVKGDMSLVGPRPLLIEYLDRYTPVQARRHEVKPGITGWAQVNGRNAITWEEKFQYDVWYVDNWSLMLDVKILWMTLLKVIKNEGINYPGQATMPEFMGSESEKYHGLRN